MFNNPRLSLKGQSLLINIIAAFLISLSGVFAQGYYLTTTVTDSIKINFENNYKISSVHIIPLTEKILLRDRTLKKSEYEIII